MSPPKIIPTLKTRVLQLARSGTYAICADDVVRSTGCVIDSARTVLSQLATAGELFRVAHGFYSATEPESKPVKRGSFVSVAIGVREAKAADLADVEFWLASKEQWPGGPTGLPSASSRAVLYTDRGSRRSA
jgi:hypothetical protein